jgi:hypothetical protein
MSYQKVANCIFRMVSFLRRFTFIAVLLSITLCRAGTIYTAEMVNNGMKTSFEVWLTDTKARFAVTESTHPNLLPGATIIILDGGSRWLWNPPHQFAYYESTLAQSKETEQKLDLQLNTEIKNDGQKELVVDQDGGKIAGIETRYYKIETHIVVFEYGRARNVMATQELWVAPALANLAPSLDFLTFYFAESAILNELIAYKKLHGYPLKSITTLASDGKITQTRMVEVKTLANNKKIPDSVFEIPANYVKKELPEASERK